MLLIGTFFKSISPGVVKTEIIPDEILATMPDMPMLAAEDISAAVLYVLGTPPHVQVTVFLYMYFTDCGQSFIFIILGT